MLHERDVMQRGDRGEGRGMKQEDKGQAGGVQEKRKEDSFL